MPKQGRNAPCSCGSGRKYKNCHGSENPPSAPPAAPPLSPETPEGPFKRIFKPDGSLNQEYVRSRLERLEELVRGNPAFFPVRFDRVQLETVLAERQDLFAEADGDESLEQAFSAFAEVVLPKLVTKEFNERMKGTFRAALNDSSLTPRDQAAVACGMVLTLPEEGPPAQPHHENPLFDLVLRICFNESMARVDFLQGLHKEKDLDDAEREARFQEFLRSVPALLYEIQQGFQAHVQKALESYRRGEYAFGIGMDMILHGLRAGRKLTEEYESLPEVEQTEETAQIFSERLGMQVRLSFTEDIGENEEIEILTRMGGFLEIARSSKQKKAAKGLSAALGVMASNSEARQMMLFTAYHEAVTGSRIYCDEAEEETGRALFADPVHLDPYLRYGEALESAGHVIRAERVYRAALSFFPDDEQVRSRLAAVAETLEPERRAEIQECIKETEAEEEEDTAGA